MRLPFEEDAADELAAAAACMNVSASATAPSSHPRSDGVWTGPRASLEAELESPVLIRSTISADSC